jgi:hypothetical protein
MVQKKFRSLHHGSEMVETSINHRKMNKNTELSILYPTSVSPPSSLEKEVLSNRQQTVAPNIHSLPLILRKKESPLLDPVRRTPNNLQKISSLLSVKNYVIPVCPNRPAYSRYANPYSILIQFMNPIKPITKHISNICRWVYTKSKINHSPNNFGKWT